MPFAVTWMHSDIILSEVKWRETNTWYHSYVESEKLVQWIYLQNRNRVLDVENKLMVTKQEDGGGINREIGTDMLWKSLGHVQLFVTLWTIQFMEFSTPEYWSGWLFPSPGDLLNPGVKARSPSLQANSSSAESPYIPLCIKQVTKKK